MDIGKLESFILEKIAKTKIPGLSIALVRDSEVIYARGFGFRDVDQGLHATPHTIYGIGSVTKSFTAIATLQLVEEGKLSLDDPVSKYVPLDIKPFGEPIRVHHLLTHTTGLPALAYAEAYISGVLGLDTTWLPLASPEDVISFMRDSEKWAVSRPGEKFFYLNEGYVLLGYIISRVSGMRYEDYVKRRILEPLGMKRTYFHKEDVEKDPDVATPYILDKEGRYIASKFPYGVTADGGLLSNVMDLSRYLMMYINRGKLGDVQVLSKEMIELMEKPHVKLPFELLGEEYYGYGLIIHKNFLGRRLIEHSGSVLVYTAFIGYVPEERIGVAVLANASGYPLSNIGMYALALMMGRDPEKELPFIRTERLLERLEGTYETYRGTMKLYVRKRGDFLYVERRDRYTESIVPLIPIELSEERAIFYTTSWGRKFYVEFYIKDGTVELIYERYKLIKVGQ
ncbi:MAG: serine hydrolase [Thermoprotei archaeon]|nr:MAG: serine hydrolase [Thermoprotei archaeon]